MEEQISKDNQHIYTYLPYIQKEKSYLLKPKCCLTTWQSQIHLTQNKLHNNNAVVNKKEQRSVDIKKHGVRHTWYQIRDQLKQRVSQRENAWYEKSENCLEEEKRLNILQKEVHFTQTYIQQRQNTKRKPSKTIQMTNRLWYSVSLNDIPPHFDKDTSEQCLSNE